METSDAHGAIRYVEGDATDPGGGGRKIIVHICNDEGKWGKGFVLAVSRRWDAPERVYRDAFKGASAHPALGDVQFVSVSSDVTVANVIGQRGIQANAEGVPPVRYEAIRAGLEKVAVEARRTGASIHMPRIGCGLAGGEWAKIEPIVLETLTAKDVGVTVYDYVAPQSSRSAAPKRSTLA